MANATFKVLEFRAVLKDDLTELYVLTSQASDGLIGVGGWYKKTIPASEPVLPILTAALEKSSFLTEWDRGHPKA